MAFRRVDDITRADVALEISARTPEDLFVEAGAALWDVMFENLAPSPQASPMEIELEAESIEDLLHLFLDELLFHKDADALLVVPTSAEIKSDAAGTIVNCRALAEKINPEIHRFIVDVKAVTMHRFSVRHEESRWIATVVFDV